MRDNETFADHVRAIKSGNRVVVVGGRTCVTEDELLRAYGLKDVEDENARREHIAYLQRVGQPIEQEPGIHDVMLTALKGVEDAAKIQPALDGASGATADSEPLDRKALAARAKELGINAVGKKTANLPGLIAEAEAKSAAATQGEVREITVGDGGKGNDIK